MERAKGFEPSTATLARWSSTTELRSLSRATAVAAVFALIAFLMLLFVILLQVTEYYDLQSLFPGELGIGMLLAAFPW
jgi:hypothetical protein